MAILKPLNVADILRFTGRQLCPGALQGALAAWILDNGSCVVTVEVADIMQHKVSTELSGLLNADYLLMQYDAMRDQYKFKISPKGLDALSRGSNGDN